GRRRGSGGSPRCVGLAAGRGRGPRVRGVFERGATQPAGMHRPSNAARLSPRAVRAWEEIAALVLSGFSRTRQNPPKGGHHRDFFTRAQTLARRSQRSREGVARRMLMEREGFSRANSALRSLV